MDPRKGEPGQDPEYWNTIQSLKEWDIPELRGKLDNLDKEPELPLPEEISQDFMMTPENLFSVWFESSPFQKALGQPPHFHGWILCDPEKDVISALQEQNGRCNVLAALTVPEIGKILETNGKMIATAQIKASELEQIYAKGQEILEKMDYWAVSDSRPVCEGHPNYWLSFMRDPAHGYVIRQMINTQWDEEK